MLLLVQAQFQNIFGFGFADKIGEILSELSGGFFPVFTVFFLAFFDFFAVFKRFAYFPCRFNMERAGEPYRRTTAFMTFLA